MKYPGPLREIPIDLMVVTVTSALVSAYRHILRSLSLLEFNFRKFTHLYFKRYEPQSPKHALSILIGIPSFLSLLDVYAGRNPPPAWSTWKVLGTFGAYFSTLIGSIAAYRISPFHPLAEYPGPLIARLSKLWMVNSFLRPRHRY